MPLKITVHAWRAVAEWRWADVDEDDVCGICYNPYDGCCSKCKMPGDDCPLITGECSHAFHLHCMLDWLERDPAKQCPKDRVPWKDKTV
ncbi:anaphase-promoting complex subunit 11 [Entophlyctis helioformis]|nr:anaphase-promoting complex subunit 11 [Entophlyctis helioformis]